MSNGHSRNQAGGPSHQAASNSAIVQASVFTPSTADVLTAGQIYLEDQQRKINEAQARLEMDRMRLAEVARREAMEAQLRAEIAAGEEARRRLEALNFERQRSSALINATGYEAMTYEPTPPTTRIVPVEEEQRSPVIPNTSWSNIPNVPTTSTRQNVSASYPSNYQHSTPQSNSHTPGQQYFSAPGAYARPQVPVLAHQYQQRQPLPSSQLSAPAQQQQRTPSYQYSHTVQPAQLKNNHPQPRQLQQSAQQRSNFQPSQYQSQSVTNNQAHSQSAPPHHHSQQSVPNSQAHVLQLAAPHHQKEAASSTEKQSSAQQPGSRISASNYAPPSNSKSPAEISPSTSSTSASQQPSHPSSLPGWQTNGAVQNFANPPRDAQQSIASNTTTQNNAPTENSVPSLKLSPLDQRRLSYIKNYAFTWLQRAEVGATESIHSSGLFIHSPSKGQAQIGTMVNNKFTPTNFVGWIQALQKISFSQDQIHQPVSVPASDIAAPLGTQPATPVLNTTASAVRAPSTLKRSKGVAESLVNALNSAHELPTTPISSLSRKSSSIMASPRTPADANKKSLARDVLLALGSREKRQRESFGESDDRALKRPALSDISVPATQPILNANDNPVFSVAAGADPFRHYRLNTSQIAIQQPSTSGQVNSVNRNEFNGGAGAGPSRKPEPSQVTMQTTIATPLGAMAMPSVSQPAPVVPEFPLLQSPQATPRESLIPATSELSKAPLQSLLATSRKSPKPAILEQPKAQILAQPPPNPNVTPLFLPETPSPSASPPSAINVDDDSLGPAESVTVRDSDAEGMDDLKEKRRLEKDQTNRKKMILVAYVEVPTPPAWVKRDFSRRRKAKARQERKENIDMQGVIDILDSDEEPEPRGANGTYSRRSQSSRIAAGEETNFSLPTPVRGPEELAVFKKSITRLQECSCKWGGCEVILCSIEKLGQHMRNHVVELQEADRYGNPILCKICGKHEAQVPYHMENHASYTLSCPYEECDESFRSSRKLLQHSLKYHHDDGSLRQSAEPFFVQSASPPDTPSALPSYMVVAKAVIPHPISKERHQLLGPWVLKNMMPIVDSVSLRRYLKAKHLGRVETPTTSDEYEFLVARSSHSCMPSRPAKIRDFGDLNSDQVSQLINDGMSLWQKEETEETEQTTALSEHGDSPSFSELPAGGSGRSGVSSRGSTDEILLCGVGFDHEQL